MTLASIFVGCVKEKIVYVEEEGNTDDENKDDENVSPDDNSVYMTFTARNELDGSGSRTQIGAGDAVLWQAGDAISVFGFTNDPSAMFTTEEGGETAAFSGEITPSLDGSYLALYPYNKDARVTGDKSNISITSKISATQTLPSTGGFDPKACNSVAVLQKGEAGAYSANFRLLGGMLAIKLQEPADAELKLKSKLDRIEFRLKDSQTGSNFFIAGNYTLKMINEVFQNMVFNLGQSKAMTVKADGDGFRLDGNTEYLVSLPPISTSKPVDLSVVFYLADGRKQTKNLTNFTLERAKIKPISTLTLSDGDFVQPQVLEIGSEEEFVNWYKGATSADKVKLISNIDLTSYGPFAAKNFYGEFDGNNFTISNMSVVKSGNYSGLFGMVSGGIIKNLTLENFKNDEAGIRYAGSIAAAIDNRTTISNCKVKGSSSVSAFIAGGIVGTAKNSSILGCEVNNINITSSNNNAGGIIGEGLEGNTVVASYVSGSINSGFGYSGGIIGSVTGANNSIIGCYSRASLTSDIIGGLYGSTSITVTVTESYYAGSNTGIDHFVSDITTKMGTMNSAITNAGYEYQYSTAGGTTELPLVIVQPSTQQ